MLFEQTLVEPCDLGVECLTATLKWSKYWTGQWCEIRSPLAVLRRLNMRGPADVAPAELSQVKRLVVNCGAIPAG